MSIYDEIEEKRKTALNRWKSPIMKEALDQIIEAIRTGEPWLPILAKHQITFMMVKIFQGLR